MFQSILITLGYTDPTALRPYHVIATSILVVFPICLVNDLKSFKYAPMISFCAIGYCCVVLFVEAFIYWEYDNAPRKIVYFRVDMNFFDSFGITFLSFMCQGAYYEALKGVDKRDLFHQKRVIPSIPT
jgi:amino acid permease